MLPHSICVCRFAEALFEATEYCSDGVEITSVSPDFRLVVRIELSVVVPCLS